MEKLQAPPKLATQPPAAGIAGSLVPCVKSMGMGKVELVVQAPLSGNCGKLPLETAMALSSKLHIERNYVENNCAVAYKG